MGGGNSAAVLVVDDERDMRDLLHDLLTQAGLHVVTACDRSSMTAALDSQRFALVILDLRLSGEDGLELARELRRSSAIPIMMLTGKGDETDRIVGLEVAADDFLMKPFNNRELLARVRAMLRRSTELSVPVPSAVDAYHHERCAFGGWVLDLTSRELASSDGEVQRLTQGEYALLETLLRAPNQVFSRDQLLERTRGDDTQVFDRTIDVLVLRLRRKIERNPRQPEFICTERGIGYYFAARVTQC